MPKPKSVAVFLTPPGRGEWSEELQAGWAGPDGASWCPDRLMGVRVGMVTPKYKYGQLPANAHDFYYRLGRRWVLPKSWRQRADAELKYALRRELAKAGVGGVMYAAGWCLAAVIYWVVRLAGRWAWRGTPEEA